jgi:hypothetical protein
MPSQLPNASNEISYVVSERHIRDGVKCALIMVIKCRYDGVFFGDTP